MKRFYYRICEGRTVNVYVDAVDKKRQMKSWNIKSIQYARRIKILRLKVFPEPSLLRRWIIY